MPLNIEKIQNVRPNNPIHYYPLVDSTMQTAALLAASGAPHGTTVLAEQQSAGIGRLGRTWISEPEVGVYCSTLLRLSIPASSLPIATLLLGLATAEAIHLATQLSCDLRWPNDVLVNRRKVAGILAQLAEGCVIAGIGINVNNASLPEGLRTPASSLLMESGGATQNREDLIAALLQKIEEFSSVLQHEGPPAILQAFTAASSYVANRRVTIEDSGLTGTTAGLDEHGFLLLRTDDGKLERVAAGGVRALD